LLAKGLKRHSISDGDLEKVFEPIDAGHIVLVIDARNSGQALESEEKRHGPMNSKGWRNWPMGRRYTFRRRRKVTRWRHPQRGR